jgi:hypothetical protein
MSGGIASAACLEQEPGTPLRLVNPNFDQAGSSNVLVFLADAMGLAQARGECVAVLAQLGEHVLWLTVVPPSLRTRSAIGSVMAKS